jgi:hypothetical protein
MAFVAITTVASFPWRPSQSTSARFMKPRPEAQRMVRPREPGPAMLKRRRYALEQLEPSRPCSNEKCSCGLPALRRTGYVAKLVDISGKSEGALHLSG